MTTRRGCLGPTMMLRVEIDSNLTGVLLKRGSRWLGLVPLSGEDPFATSPPSSRIFLKTPPASLEDSSPPPPGSGSHMGQGV